jgi:hypothetical protein
MAVSKIERSYHKAFITRKYTHNYSIGANSAVAISAANLGITAIDGYNPVGIITFDTANNNIFCRYLVATTNGAVGVLTNIISSTINSTFSVTVLWIRSDML